MMDASALYPKGFHPIRTGVLPDLSGYATSLSRLAAAQPVKYYYIDFGISVHIPHGEPRLVLGTAGLDQEVPELSDSVPYDPFKVDVFILGNVFTQQIYTVRRLYTSTSAPLTSFHAVRDSPTSSSFGPSSEP